jgi:hypothetical protein
MMLMPVIKTKSKKEPEPEEQDAAFPGTQLIHPSFLHEALLWNYWLAPRVIISLPALQLPITITITGIFDRWGPHVRLRTRTDDDSLWDSLFFSTVTADKTLCTSGKSK